MTTAPASNMVSEQESLSMIRDFWKGKGRYICSIHPTDDMYLRTFDRNDVLERAPKHIPHYRELPGANVPAFYANYGTVSTAKYYGGKAQFDSTGENIFINPVAQTVAEAEALTPRSVDDASMDAAHALALFEDVKRATGKNDLFLRTPDMQGPLNTAGLVMNQEEMLMAMYTEPDALHRFLDKVTDHIIEFSRYLFTQANNRVCGNIWPHTFFPAEEGIMFTEDIMPLVNAEMYKEFGVPYAKRLSDAFGGAHIHCCGDWGRHAQTLRDSGMKLKAIECHYPFTKIDELSSLADETVFVPVYNDAHGENAFQGNVDYYEYLLRETPKHYRYYFAFFSNIDEACAFIDRHGVMGE